MMGASRPVQATLAAILSGLLLIAVVCGQGGTQVGGSYSTINGIPCDLGERLAFHIHAHVAIYANGQPLTVPYGIGIWGQPLSSSQAASATGPVIAYVNGELSSGDPSQITLRAHELIQLDVGDETPPQPFTFPPGL
jgi:hypothetical protein